MNLELDHVFVFVSEGAPEADKLIEFCFSEGEPNIYPGQGTSNCRFFFNNMMLELLWVSNIDEIKSFVYQSLSPFQPFSDFAPGG